MTEYKTMTKSNKQYLGVMTSGSRTYRGLKKIDNIIERNIVRKHRTKKTNSAGVAAIIPSSHPSPRELTTSMSNATELTE